LLFVGNLSKFEEEIKTKIGRSDTMGTQEYLLDKAEKKGIQKGKLEGRMEGKIEMLRELGFTIAEICQKLGLAKPEVEKYFKGV
jgi:predicted transposase YdaD